MEKVTRMTRQKKLVLEILRSTKCHPTADWIYAQARKVIPDISLGTVYRNLSNLKEAGEIMELNFGSTFSRYDGNPRNHYHFVCRECRQVFDLDVPLIEGLEQRISRLTGVEVEHYRLEFYGCCENCRRQKNRSR